MRAWDAENRLVEVGPADDVTPASGDVKVACVYADERQGAALR